jgi:ubiquinone biosynthesis protein COQ9
MAGTVTSWLELDVPTQVCLPVLKTVNCTHPHLRRRTQLLKLAVPLVKQHGFTRTALAHSVLALPEPHAAPLPESTVTTLFGEGDTARRTLIRAWLEEGRTHMRSVPVEDVKGALLARLEYNMPVLEHLPEVPCTNA